MNEQDIDLYLRVKNPGSFANIAIHTALISVGLAFIASFIPSVSEYTKYLLLFAIILGISTYGAGHRSYVSRKDLIALIERNINSDPKLIALVATRKQQYKKTKG
jgi:hypothetical protein